MATDTCQSEVDHEKGEFRSRHPSPLCTLGTASGGQIQMSMKGIESNRGDPYPLSFGAPDIHGPLGDSLGVGRCQQMNLNCSKKSIFYTMKEKRRVLNVTKDYRYF